MWESFYIEYVKCELVLQGYRGRAIDDKLILHMKNIYLLYCKHIKGSLFCVNSTIPRKKIGGGGIIFFYERFILGRWWYPTPKKPYWDL